MKKLNRILAAHIFLSSFILMTNAALAEEEKKEGVDCCTALAGGLDPVVVQRLGKEKAIGFMRIPGTNSCVKISGNVKFTFVYDQHAAGNGPAYDYFMAQNILRPGAKTEKGELRMHARESSLGMQTFIPIYLIDGTEINLGTYIDMDFFGSSQTEESLFTPLSLRAKNVYFTLGDLLIGQTDSVFCGNDSHPETADFSGPTGFCGGRHPQIRYTFKGKATVWEVALENPEGEYINFDGETKFASRTHDGYFASDQCPDITTAFRCDFSGGYVKARAMGRQIHLTKTAGGNDISVYGWGAGLSSVYKYWGSSSVFLDATYGQGIGRYLGDANGYAVYLDPQNKAHTMAAFGGIVGFQQYWSENWKWRSTVAFGLTQIIPHRDLVSHSYTVEDKDMRGATLKSETKYAEINKIIRSLQVNTFCNPLGPNVDMGAEYLRGERILKVKSGPDKGVISRFIVTVNVKFGS
ncbi:MAG: porin [Holosporales bacterium]|nr:porin [Holosporales bacterium]